MATVLISHREDTRQVCWQLYLNLTHRFPNVTIAGNIATVLQPQIEPRFAVIQAVQDAKVLIVVVSNQWQGDWLADAGSPDQIAIRAALATQKPIFILRYQGAPLPSDLPNEFSGLNVATSMSFDESSADQVCDNLAYSLAPLILDPYARPVLPTTMPVPAYTPPPAQLDDIFAPIVQEPMERAVVRGMERSILKGIDATAFQHPLDRAATEALRKVKGFDLVVTKLMELGTDRINYLFYTGTCLSVGPRQFNSIYEILVDACYILDIPQPDIYLLQSPEANAYTWGTTKPYILLTSAVVDRMNDEELMALIAGELGHIKCGHVLYDTMAELLPVLADWLGTVTFGIGNLLSIAMQAAIVLWQRRSVLSADRASLLVMQDPRPVVSMLAKLAGGSVSRFSDELSLEVFLEQVKSYRESDDTLDKFYRFLVDIEKATFPLVIERAHMLNEWVDSPEYERIIEGNYARTMQVRGGNCPSCGGAVRTTDRFCPTCGRPTGNA